MQGFIFSLKVSDKTRYKVVKTYYKWYSQLVESFPYLSESCKDNEREKKYNRGKCRNNMKEDKNGAGDNILLDAKPNDDFDIDFVKPEEVKKRVSAIVKSSTGKIADLKLMNNFVANCLVGITPLKNPIFNTLDKAGIAAANFLANIIANFFDIVSLVNFFVAPAGFFVESSSLGILMLANSISISTKFFINNFVALVDSSAIASIGLFIKANMLNNFFADVLPFIKSLTKLTFNTIYKK